MMRIIKQVGKGHSTAVLDFVEQVLQMRLLAEMYARLLAVFFHTGVNFTFSVAV